jgi:hypothetical protein
MIETFAERRLRNAAEAAEQTWQQRHPGESVVS